MSATLETREINNVLKRLERVADSVDNTKAKRRILSKGATIVRRKAEELAPKGKAPHYRYNTPKISSRVRAPKGKGRKVAKYLPGNLAKGIKRLLFRRSDSVFIGPKFYKKTATGTFGASRGRVDPYYAQMVFGSALAFQRRVLIPALNIAAPEALRRIEGEVKKEIDKEARRQNLK